MTTAVSETYRFGQFELDAVSGELLREGRGRRLQAQPARLLVLLVRHAGTLVPHEQIRSELWGDDTFVEFDQAVHFAIRQIREALGDSAERPLYIETVPRKGYRFIAPVEPLSPAPESAAAEAPRRVATTVRLKKALWANIAELRLAEPRRQRAQALLVAMMLGLVLVLIGAGIYIYVTRSALVTGSGA